MALKASGKISPVTAWEIFPGQIDERMRNYTSKTKKISLNVIMPDLLNIPGFTPKLLASACIAGPAIGLTLYGVLRVCGGWQYTPLVFAAVFLLGIGLFSTWVWYFSGE